MSDSKTQLRTTRGLAFMGMLVTFVGGYLLGNMRSGGLAYRSLAKEAEQALRELGALSETAAREIKTIIEQQELDAEKVRLRVGVKGGGCSGFSYEMYFDTQVEDDDIVEAFGPDGDVRVLVDPQSAEMIRGATLDFKDGLIGAGFSINNPNVTRSCGCGNSFS